MKEKYILITKLVKNENIDEINDLLIEAGKKADREFLVCIDYLIEKANKSILEKTKLNVVYFLGEIGKANVLENKYLVYLIKTYYDSDRWVRNEVIQSLSKLINDLRVSSDIFHILAYAVIEDYTPIKINTLKLLNKIKQLPDFILKNLLKVIDNNNLEVVEDSIRIFKDNIKNDLALFEFLNISENYKLLSKNTIRRLLIEYFDSLIKVDTFRKKIDETDWQVKYKKLFLNEIDTYQSILINRK